MKQEKRKKRAIWISVLLIILLLTISSTTLFVQGAKEGEIQKKEREEYPEEQTISCYKEEGHDGVEETETVYLQRGVLISRTNRAEWSKSTPSEKTCEYYTKNSTGLNAYQGITSTCNCDSNRGTYTATYTIAELDRTQSRLKQFDYLNEKGIFNVTSWRIFMEDSGFDCKEQ